MRPHRHCNHIHIHKLKIWVRKRLTNTNSLLLLKCLREHWQRRECDPNPFARLARKKNSALDVCRTVTVHITQTYISHAEILHSREGLRTNAALA